MSYQRRLRGRTVLGDSSDPCDPSNSGNIALQEACLECGGQIGQAGSCTNPASSSSGSSSLEIGTATTPTPTSTSTSTSPTSSSCPSPTPNCADVVGWSVFDVSLTNPNLPAGCQCTLPSGALANWNGVTLSPAAGGALSTADVGALQTAGWTSSQLGRSSPVSTVTNPFGTLVPNLAQPGGITGTAAVVLIGGGLAAWYFLASKKPRTKTVVSKRRSRA
jgi:hypothetical protein